MKITLPIKRLFDDVELPSYAYAKDAGLDLRAHESIVLQPMQRALISTGLALAIPEGYAGFVMPRSGRAAKEGLSIVNTPGLIDSHYRGEIKVCLINLSADTPITIEFGERIAQLVIEQVPEVSIEEVVELDETDRGTGGFGSSGK